jgi:hypothetical protein
MEDAAAVDYRLTLKDGPSTLHGVVFDILVQEGAAGTAI